MLRIKRRENESVEIGDGTIVHVMRVDPRHGEIDIDVEHPDGSIDTTVTVRSNDKLHIASEDEGYKGDIIILSVSRNQVDMGLAFPHHVNLRRTELPKPVTYEVKNLWTVTLDCAGCNDFGILHYKHWSPLSNAWDFKKLEEQATLVLSLSEDDKFTVIDGEHDENLALVKQHSLQELDEWLHALIDGKLNPICRG